MIVESRRKYQQSVAEPRARAERAEANSKTKVGNVSKIDAHNGLLAASTTPRMIYSKIYEPPSNI